MMLVRLLACGGSSSQTWTRRGAPLWRRWLCQHHVPLQSSSSQKEVPGVPGEVWGSQKVRRTFMEFYQQEHQHTFVPSSPVRPRGDPSLLFVNAGMNQFKPLLLGTVDPRSEMAGYRRAVNSQKCVRAGGKHNDLDDVGRDVYHHTFFEMLGNWSFNGDYFKEEACSMAWSLLTEHYGIPPDRLYVSYFCGDVAAGLPADEETRHIWLDIGVPSERVLPFGLKENFWEMGDTGPCGPCTEIHFDHVGGRNAAPLVNADDPDVVEIWNLVFMQHNREADQSLLPLPQCSVDTGMGLERLVTILQGRRSNYDTDLFTPLMDAMGQVSRVGGYQGRTGAADQGSVDMAYRVVADHARTLSVCIADGVYPGMSGPELVLRRILRRAVRFCAEVLQAPQGSLASLVPVVADILGNAYPELHREKHRIMDIINDNEVQFLSALQQGRRVIDSTLNKKQTPDGFFPAPVAWSLFRNLGFPLDLVHLMLEERGATLNQEEMDRLAEREKRLSLSQECPEHTGVKLDVHSLALLQNQGVPHTDDSPKYHYSLDAQGRYVFAPCTATVLALCSGRGLVEEVTEGERCGLILDRTIFYSEQGGQTHDQGYFTTDALQDALFAVESVDQAGGYVVHQVIPAAPLRTGDQLLLHLDQAHRLSCMVKHTATHLLNLGLRQLLGGKLEQRGSSVTADRLRFDCTVKGSLSVSQLQDLERSIQNIIRSNLPVYTMDIPLDRARTIPGLRTVDQVYPDPVRVVSVGVEVPELLDGQMDRQTSVELCCGTHLLSTGAIEDLVIVSERQIVKGISRIVAVTGQQARQAREAGEVLSQDVESLSARVSGSAPSGIHSAHSLAKEAGLLTDALDSTAAPQWLKRELQTQLKSLQRKCNTAIRKLENKEAADKAQLLLQKNRDKGVLVDCVDADSISMVMKTVNQLSDRVPGCLVMLLAHQQHSGNVLCACQVPKGEASLSASDWALAVCHHLGGSAGGSSLVAKGSGTCDDITEALRWAEQYARMKTQQNAD